MCRSARVSDLSHPPENDESRGFECGHDGFDLVLDGNGRSTPPIISVGAGVHNFLEVRTAACARSVLLSEKHPDHEEGI